MKRIFIFTLCLFVNFSIFSQSSSSKKILYSGQRNYIFTEKTDLRRYDNGKYVGLVSREVSSFISPTKKNDDYIYNGNFFILQKTKRNAQNVFSGINDSIDSVFKISSNGEFSMIEDNGFPSFRNFPSYFEGDIKIGDSWTAESQRAVDPLEKGVFTKMPILVQYTYVGDINFNNEECFELKAVWATRYGNVAGSNYFDFDGDNELLRAIGNNLAKIYVSKKNGTALLISDKIDESYSYKNGKEVSFKGTISMFTEYPPSVNAQKYTEDFESLKKDDDISYEKTSKGTRLSIHNLQFEPNSPQLLEKEKSRLDKIALVLQKMPEKTKFLIEGHTARIGDESNEYELSLERAHTIAKELINRGIESNRIICKGYGGSLPIAENETSQGRAKNRRVEITILE